MEYRNAVYQQDGSIFCEINHVDFGWLPFTASPDDVEETGRELFARIEADGAAAPYVEPVPTAEELAAYAADLRWRREVGGTIWNTWPVHTDRESQAKIDQESKAIDKGLRQDGDGWKFADGVFRALTNAEFQDLEAAVYRHVKDSYALEAQVLQGIQDGTITSRADVEAAFA
jgi:hypothetical protein